MRQFATGAFRLRDAPRGLRMIYAGFLVFTAIGLASQAEFQAGRIGLSQRRIATYYRGGEDADTMAFPKPFGQLLEVTHAHAFMMGIVFLVLAHLFAASSPRATTRAVVIALGFAGMLGDLLAPWLVRYVAAGFAWFQIAAWLALWAGGGAMVAVSFWECVTPTRVGRR